MPWFHYQPGNPQGTCALFAFNFKSIFQPIRGDNLLELMRAAKLTTALEAVNFAGLDEVLNGEGPFTLFLPTNEAFEKLPNDVATDKGQEYTSISR